MSLGDGRQCQQLIVLILGPQYSMVAFLLSACPGRV